MVSPLTGIAVLRAVPVTKERVTVMRTLIVLQVSSVERITAGTSETLLNHWLTAALNQVKDKLIKYLTILTMSWAG